MKVYENRKYVIIAIFIIAFLMIWIKLFEIQILNQEYKISSENNSQRRITEYPSRGLIYDRNGNLLVCNELAYDLVVIPRNIKNLDTALFCEKLSISIEDFKLKLDKASAYSLYKPSIFYKQITREQFASLQEQMYKFKGFYAQTRTLRSYKENVAAHVVGDIGEIDLEQLKNDNYYIGGDYVGKSGVEKYYEKELRGRKGVKIYLVNVRNMIQGSYSNGKYDTLAIPGQDLTLTIDLDLQKYGELLMNNKIGGIVAIEPNSGEILSIVSSPSYNPQLLVGRNRGKNYDSLLNVKSKPLINRAVSSTYPPGSIFKIVVALIALENKSINENTFFPCDVAKLGCHGHPECRGVAKAIQYSCNPYFYYTFKTLIRRDLDKSIFKDSQIGLDLTYKQILNFGFGTALDIGLPSVNKGQVPNSDFYNKIYGKNRWAFSTIYSLGIGQGELLASPLQLANFCTILANRGSYINPHIAKKIGDNELIGKNTQKIFVPINKKYFNIVVQGMEAVVNKEFGTGANARFDDITVCGKTGTAQNPHGKDHSVFIAFAPKDNPQIALAVYIENAGFGGTWAAPIAKLMIEKYIKKNITDTILEKKIINTSLISVE